MSWPSKLDSNPEERLVTKLLLLLPLLLAHDAIQTAATHSVGIDTRIPIAARMYLASATGSGTDHPTASATQRLNEGLQTLLDSVLTGVTQGRQP
ncbi:hypothetical protein P3T76_007250 [Phytophthora citrophthora]|uniref:Uncharacterized protein n=1 Tax=Phytophthora citrophthora TaxID=4793 RepID=A0AAD9GM65_9STRA|nr:hypothetical protein P3T76_007247 [Phytophthora citrophthora]KAK1941384.1 hypothetical protein P3T76_007250 [Phytophthora citrophthora]